MWEEVDIGVLSLIMLQIFVFLFFLSHKDLLKVKLITFSRSLKKDGIEVKIIQCNNTGENICFKNEATKQPNLNLTFKYIAPSSPQQNGRVERKLQTLYGRMRAINHGLDLPVPI